MEPGRLGTVTAAAAVAFASTSVDDALVLVVYFASAAEGRSGFKRRHVWIGQIEGFTVLTGLSLLGAFAGSFLSPHYAGLLGFVPLLIGLWRTREWCGDEDGDDKSVVAALPVDPETPADAKTLFQDRLEDGAKPEKCCSCLAAVQELWSPHSLQVAAVTVASGGDNVSIYVPLLVAYSPEELLLTVAVFYALLVMWLLAADAMASFRLVAGAIGKCGRFLVPVALILLGLYILWSTDVVSLLPS